MKEANGPSSRLAVASGDFLGRGRLVISEADVGSLWNASLCPDGSFGLFYGSEAVVSWLRRASLERFTGNWWFFGSEAVVGILWNASLCPDGSFGLFFGSEAVVAGLWRASLRRSCKEL